MASYSLLYRPSVEKDLRSLPREAIARIVRQIDALQQDPLPRHSVKLAGSEGLYRIRVGNYRVVYGVDRHARQVTVHYVRHRRDVYR
ncbi:MAG: type II toxin-antitoxin system RelE/ParE family toxin [Chloroflexi bacterium]|nr:type II toxin-antitoxin system RelE/ParE family toxin [Chloroflexota bacterium]